MLLTLGAHAPEGYSTCLVCGSLRQLRSFHDKSKTWRSFTPRAESFCFGISLKRLRLKDIPTRICFSWKRVGVSCIRTCTKRKYTVCIKSNVHVAFASYCMQLDVDVSRCWIELSVSLIEYASPFGEEMF